jgi:hypothetical protein
MDCVNANHCAIVLETLEQNGIHLIPSHEVKNGLSIRDRNLFATLQHEVSLKTLK